MDEAAKAKQRRQFQESQVELQELVKREPCLIFSTTVCPWCDQAAAFFQRISRPCRKIELDQPKGDPQRQMLAVSLAMATDQRTVPNIFLAGKHVGGFDTLLEAYEQCKVGGMPAEHADVCNLLME